MILDQFISHFPFLFDDWGFEESEGGILFWEVVLEDGGAQVRLKVSHESFRFDFEYNMDV